MTKQVYQYRVITLLGNDDESTKILNDYAKEGWEVVCLCEKIGVGGNFGIILKRFLKQIL